MQTETTTDVLHFTESFYNFSAKVKNTRLSLEKRETVKLFRTQFTIVNKMDFANHKRLARLTDICVYT